MMNDLQTILNQARAAYAAEQTQAAAQVAADEQARQKQQEQERAEVREWLLTILPALLVDCIDLSCYSHSSAQYHNYNSDPKRKGTWLTIVIPQAFPINFNAYLSHTGEFELVQEPYRAYAPEFFAVPSSASVRRSEEDDELYISYNGGYTRNHTDWQTAVGYALAQWQEYGERLTAELDYDGPEPEPEPELEPAPEPKTTEERTLDALEGIAASLDQLVTFKVYGA
jgi:hypothetical protein